MTAALKSPHARLTARVAQNLARQAFRARWRLEMSMFPGPAARRCEAWVEKNWPLHVDEAREILSDILPDVLAVTYRDAKAAARRRDEAEDEFAYAAAVVEHACALTSNAVGERLTDLFEGELLGVVPVPLVEHASEGAAGV